MCLCPGLINTAIVRRIRLAIARINSVLATLSRADDLPRPAVNTSRRHLTSPHAVSCVSASSLCAPPRPLRRPVRPLTGVFEHQTTARGGVASRQTADTARSGELGSDLGLTRSPDRISSGRRRTPPPRHQCRRAASAARAACKVQTSYHRASPPRHCE